MKHTPNSIEACARSFNRTPGKPGNVQLERISSTELYLTWTSPSDPNGVIIGYRIVWSILRDDKNMSVPNSVSKTEIINNGSTVSFGIDKLEPYSVYRVSLNGMTSIGNGTAVTLTARTNQSSPGKPGNVQLERISSTELYLTWTSPSDPNGVIIGYRIVWSILRDDKNMSVSNSVSKTEIINNGSTVSFRIDKLEPYSVYSVSLNAMTSIGNGTVVTFTARTNQSTPGKPRSVQLEPISSTELGLTWTSPSDPNGVITGYRIVWSIVRDDKNMSVSNSVSKTEIKNNGSAVSFRIDKLEPYSVYNVSLNAMTSIGNGTVVTLTARTNQSTPGKPGSVQLERISSTELDLTWTSPSDPNGVIIGYRIVWSILRDDRNMSVSNSVSKTEIINNGNAVSFGIDKLEPYSVYSVSLNAMTSIGNGTVVTPTARTSQSTPGKPGSFQLERISSTELYLTWTSPPDPNGVIIGYRIVWSILRDDKNMSVPNSVSKTEIINNGSIVSFRIEKLEPYSVYSVSLNAMTIIGNGTVVTLTARTNQSTPSAPLNVLASNDSSTRLNITWDEPEKFNGVLTRYTVYYKLVRDDNDVKVAEKKWMSINVMTTQTNVTLRDLEKYSWYEIKVSASTEVGEGENTTAEEFRTAED
ncbi:phosphatidylinositol phosphatase PTPRQ, partial [Paramuricea clavata]